MRVMLSCNLCALHNMFHYYSLYLRCAEMIGRQAETAYGFGYTRLLNCLNLCYWGFFCKRFSYSSQLLMQNILKRLPAHSGYALKLRQKTVYLCKRTMQNKARLELADYEAESLARLQRAFARKWEFIFMQAEAQAKVDKKRDKVERKILDSQERAFWDVHRPVPGCVNTTDTDIKKSSRMKQPHKTRKIQFWQAQLERHRLKMSKVADSLISYSEQYTEYDPCFTAPEPSNPWSSDDTTCWELEASKEPGQQRVRRWGFGFNEVLKDPAGREQFLKFLESEFSSENLRFWLAVQELKKRPIREVATLVQNIWQEFLAPGAQSAINVDSKSYAKTTHNIRDPGRYTFEDAQEHIYKLMKSDSYSRFLRSNSYQELLQARKKVQPKKETCV
ncbi:Regulator of G-protein signaling 7 [Merluccius polli]|uniref:Regulator of G-protein signaling 7 n=1 Tax=Merluccius polli TaxID=89951 RepID=A0AA47PA18_MERPO|nr:Regulator of G-protein signaling 7 [Merluccius polli]